MNKKETLKQVKCLRQGHQGPSVWSAHDRINKILDFLEDVIKKEIEEEEEEEEDRVIFVKNN